MDHQAGRIERESDDEQRSLVENRKDIDVTPAGSWRGRFQQRPGVFLGLAFAGGLIASQLIPSRSDDGASSDRKRDGASKARIFWKGLQAAIATAVVSHLKQFAADEAKSLGNRLLTSDASPRSDARRPVEGGRP